jgi:hypothetical protein
MCMRIHIFKKERILNIHLLTKCTYEADKSFYRARTPPDTDFSGSRAFVYAITLIELSLSLSQLVQNTVNFNYMPPTKGLIITSGQ